MNFEEFMTATIHMDLADLGIVKLDIRLALWGRK